MFGSRSCHVFNVKKTFKCCFPCDRSCSCRIKDIFASVCVIWAVFDFNPLSGAQCCCLLELERMEELEGPRGLSIQDDETGCSPGSNRRHLTDN